MLGQNVQTLEQIHVTIQQIGWVFSQRFPVAKSNSIPLVM